MNLVADQRTETLVDQLMPPQRPLALKLGSDDERVEMVIIVARDANDRVAEAGDNEFFDLGRFHVGDQASVARGAQCKPLDRGYPNAPRRLCMIADPSRQWSRAALVGCTRVRAAHKNKDSMLLNIVEIIGGLVLLIWGADRFVHGAAAGARNFGIAPLLIGLTIVAFATSAPEILVSIVASLRGEADLAFGNAIGSNIANIGLVLGTTAIIRPIELRSATLRREMPALLAVSLLTVSLFLDTFLSRIDGFVMLTGLVIVMIWLARLGMRSAASDPMAEDYEAEIPRHVSMKAAFVWLVIGLATLLLGAELLVDGSIEVARILGVSEVFIGVTLVAIGTSLPELAVSLVSALKGEYGLAIGNIVGSNIFNLLAVIGIAAAIDPSALAPSVLSLHIFVMVAFTLVLFAMTYDYDGKNDLSRLEGIALLTAYFAYFGYVVTQSV